MEEHVETSESPSRDPGMVATLVISLAAALGLAAWAATKKGAPRGETPLDFPPIRVDQDRLQDQRRQTYGEADEAIGSEELDKLLEDVRRLNVLQFEKNSEDKQRELAETVSYRANEVIPQTGYDAFIGAGHPLFEACRTGLESLMSDLRNGNITYEKAASNPDAETYADYRRNCGNLLPMLVKRGLVDNSGHWRKPTALKKTIFDILQRYRWANIIRTRNKPIEQLTRYERRLLMRWRIEDPVAYAMRERRRYVDLLEDSPGLVPDYDVALARAKLAYRENKLHRTVKILRQQIREGSGDTDRYRHALEWLERRHKGSGAGSSGGEDHAG